LKPSGKPTIFQAVWMLGSSRRLYQQALHKEIVMRLSDAIEDRMETSLIKAISLTGTHITIGLISKYYYFLENRNKLRE
jgi:hypothetical protein